MMRRNHVDFTIYKVIKINHPMISPRYNCKKLYSNDIYRLKDEFGLGETGTFLDCSENVKNKRHKTISLLFGDPYL